VAQAQKQAQKRTIRLARSDDRFKTGLLGEVAGAPGYKNDSPETTMLGTSPPLATTRGLARRAGASRAFLLVFAVLASGPAHALVVQGEPLGADEREELETMRRRGENAAALAALDEVLAESPDDAVARALRARCRYQACDYSGAVEDARAALAAAQGGTLGAEDARTARRAWLEILTELGRASEALALGGTALRSSGDARDAWALGHALLSAGRRAEATEAFRAGAESGAGEEWEQVFARARCERALGLFERAARTLVQADELASAGRTGSDPDVLVELGDVYFEAYGEVEDPVSRAHSPAELAREALELARDHEGARLLLFRLHRWNWQRTSQSPEQILAQVFVARPDSIDGLVQRVSAALDDGDLPTARAALARLAKLAPERRDVRAEGAALAWIEHRREEARSELDRLLAEDPGDSRPELVVGWHLLELYRFAEALGFCEQATSRDPRDWMAWIQLGRALANTGDEARAREAFARSLEVGEGRRNAWRDNTQLVLKRMQESMVLSDHGALRFLWRPEEGAVLRHYLPDFYGRAREELAARYGHTPGVTQVEVFRRWEDFSVRSTGFQGYPALGVCFGPVVTAVSPLCELRGTFSWARTSFHEFTHVIHLGLSNNRCPRWVTEGLATWEEGERRAAWWRNMRRELLDARANGEIFPLRRLNNAFRGPSVLFAYYQSGLLCQMLIEAHGFPPMVRLLEAFDRGADLDGAFREVFARTPEEIDADFARFVERMLAPLAIQPRWSSQTTTVLRYRLGREVPAAPEARRAWAEDWCRVAWGSYGQGKRIDAEEALRLAGLAGDLPPQGEFLRGELALAQGDPDSAAAALRAGFERGGEDYRARMALGSLLARKGKGGEALAEFQAAERNFPGFADAHFSAELEQARLHEAAGDEPEAMGARLRWLAWNAGDYEVRARVAEWMATQGRHAEAERLWHEANEVDPFRRHLHFAWGKALRELGRHEEALREFRVAVAVPAELDGDVLQEALGEIDLAETLELTGLTREQWDRLSPQEQFLRLRAATQGDPEDGPRRASGMEERFRQEEPLALGLAALSALALGRSEEARAALEAALELDAACAPALEAQKLLP
jgi:predicted Zn-dependent protease